MSDRFIECRGVAAIRDSTGSKLLLRHDDSGFLMPLGGLLRPTRQAVADIESLYATKAPTGFMLTLDSGHVQHFTRWFAERRHHERSIRALVEQQLDGIVPFLRTIPEKFVGFGSAIHDSVLFLIEVYQFEPPSATIAELEKSTEWSNLLFVSKRELGTNHTYRSVKIHPIAHALIARKKHLPNT